MGLLEAPVCAALEGELQCSARVSAKPPQSARQMSKRIQALDMMGDSNDARKETVNG